MSDQENEKPAEDQPEEAYPGHGPHADEPTAEGTGDPLEGVEPNFTVTPGTETREERAAIAEEQVEKITADDDAKAEDAAEDADDDDEPELSAESDDPDPVLPAEDSEVHGESTIQPGATDPNL